MRQNLGKKVYKKLKEITTDAGYGSEENYDYLGKKKIKAFVKFNTFEKEQDQNYQKKYKAFSKENLFYNQEEDYYVCPMRQKMLKTHENQKKTTEGHTQTLSHYHTKNCEGCSLLGQYF